MKRLVLALLVVLALSVTACRSVPPFRDTGLGNAFDLALFGAHEEYVEAVDFMYSKTGRELTQKYEAAENSSVVDPVTGEVNLEWANLRFRLMQQYAEEIAVWESLADTVAKYEGIDLKADASESEDAARKRARQFLKAIVKGLEETLDE